jgi:nucleotide-binding universal stress UspA family protein
MTEPPQSWVSRFIFGSAISSTLEQAPISLLVIRQPRWPLRQILLVVRSEEVQGLAAGWTVRLARASGAAVTVLALVPQFSPMPSREAQQQGLLMLLAHHTPLERQVAYVSQQLQEEGMEASLRLRPGSPEQQIQAELNAQSYDLIILAAESKDGWLRRLLGESVEPVLNQATCPVLIVKPRHC